MRKGAWGQEHGDGSMGMGPFFWYSFFRQFGIFCSSNDFISHIGMEAWVGEDFLVLCFHTIFDFFCDQMILGTGAGAWRQDCGDRSMETGVFSTLFSYNFECF